MKRGIWCPHSPGSPLYLYVFNLTVCYVDMFQFNCLLCRPAEIVTNGDQWSRTHDCRDLTPDTPFRTGGNISGAARKMGLYEREVIVYSQVIEHFRSILSQRGKQVGMKSTCPMQRHAL